MDNKNKIEFTDPRTLEKYSSAFTLSDMEIFIFPELFYPLILANIMSPVIWEWRKDPWFKDIEKKSFTYKVNRIKQFIIHNYVFNLDLSTWGLTTKDREIERFRHFFDMDLLKRSNALFGYEGDKYYFDIDIRKHFGLDKYNSDVIPYWKTETIEAMTAFRRRKNFTTGAGECVSLSSLYAAAMFIIGRIPLEKIFVIATPLHSQNFITEKDGIITNNRRIVTKNMWFNGTSLSEKARRALEYEKVTIVSHISGYIHLIYKDATIDRDEYKRFSAGLREFLTTGLTPTIFVNFLRFKNKYKSLFQLECECAGIKRYISLDKIFEYEHISKYKVSSETRDQLVKEIECDEFHLSPLQDKILLNEAEKIIDEHRNNDLKDIENKFIKLNNTVQEDTIHEMFNDISDFLYIDPVLPDEKKNYIPYRIPKISTEDSREKIVSEIYRSKDISELAELTLYVYRQMDQISWLPFIKASIERNPVCFNELNGKSIKEVSEILSSMPDQSIYDGKRLALPDEVWNYGCGDGIEKAFLLADFIIQKDKSSLVKIDIDNKDVTLRCGNYEHHFTSDKSLIKSLTISGNDYYVE
ncbi:MAG: hypothetical protein JXN62_00140 [Bacteroidales bacterium]|nr:hypothetical protein [Bacteroidales bacterium]